MPSVDKKKTTSSLLFAAVAAAAGIGISIAAQDATPAVLAVSNLLTGVATEVTTIQLGKGSEVSKYWKKLKAQLAPNNFLHEEIQAALTESFLEAFTEFEEEFAQRIGKEFREPDRVAVQELCKLLREDTKKLAAGRLMLVDEECFEAFLLTEFKLQESFRVTTTFIKMVPAVWHDEISDHDPAFYSSFVGAILPLWRKYFLRDAIHNDSLRNAYMLWQANVSHGYMRRQADVQMEVLRRIEARLEALAPWSLSENIRKDSPFENLPKREEYIFLHSGHAVGRVTNALKNSRKVVLTGQPGVGKTITAVEVAHNLYNESGYSVFWVKAKDELQMLEGYAGLATLMGIGQHLPDVPLEEQIEHLWVLAKEVKVVIDRHAPWLLVLDNMDDWFFKMSVDSRQQFDQLLDRFMPNSEKGRILITSCDRPEHIDPIKGFHTIPMRLMGIEDGARFLLQRAGLIEHILQPSEQAAANVAGNQYWQDALAISRSLDGLPLALDVAAAVISEMQRERFGFTPAKYLEMYEAERHSLMKYAHDDSSHESLLKVFSISLERLSVAERPSAQHAVDLLKICTFLSPDNIPLPLLETARTTLVEAGRPDFDTLTAVKEAYDARLLDFDAGQQVVSLHKITQKVLWEIMLEDRTALFWLRQATSTLANSLDKGADWLPILYSHIITLEDHGLQRFDQLELSEADFWESLGDQTNISPLQTIIKDINVLRAIQVGARWDVLLLGIEDPTFTDLAHSYTNWHIVEQPEWLERIKYMMASISRVCSPERARNVFVCLYLLAHFWWDSYLSGDNISSPLLDIWENTHRDARDQAYVRWLRQLGDSYPPEREFLQRESGVMRGKWRRVATAATALKEALDNDIPEAEQDSHAYRYAQAILNTYLTQARTVYFNQEPDFAALDLLEEAEAMLWENDDSFHVAWMIKETCEACLQLGRQCRSLATRRLSEKGALLAKSMELFERAWGEAQRGIGLSVEMAQDQDDVIDLEVTTNFYRILAEVYWEKDRDGRMAAVDYAIVIFTAYIWLGEEWDVYSLEFLDEQVERFLVWLEAVQALEPAVLPAILELTHQIWHGRSLGEDALGYLLLPGNLPQVQAVILPERPDEVGTPGEPTAAYIEMRYNLTQEIPKNLSALNRQGGRLSPIGDDWQSVLQQIIVQVERPG